MRRVLTSCAVLSVVFAVALFSASVASARPASWQQVDVTVLPDESGGMMLVSGELPESVKLPAEAELSVPAGSTLQWIGEILGGDPSADPELTYTKSTVDGSDVYLFKLTKSRTAQIEVPVQGAAAFDGTNYVSSIKWSATQDVPRVRLSMRVPENAQIVQPSDGAVLMPGDSDYRLYAKSFDGVKAGDEPQLSFSYQAAASPAAGQSAASTGSTAPAIIILVGLAAAAAFVLAIRQKMAGAKAGRVQTASTLAHDADVASTQSASEKANAASMESPAAAQAGADEEGDYLDTRSSNASGRTRRNLVTIGIVAVIATAAILVGSQAAKPKIEGDSISETFSQGEPCATAKIAVSVPRDADPAETAKVLFAALRTVKGMNVATYNFKTSTLEAGFCESQASEQSVRDALAPTGLLANETSGQVPATTTGDASGS